jgi:hypothetical protein
MDARGRSTPFADSRACHPGFLLSFFFLQILVVLLNQLLIPVWEFSLEAREDFFAVSLAERVPGVAIVGPCNGRTDTGRTLRSR